MADARTTAPFDFVRMSAPFDFVRMSAPFPDVRMSAPFEFVRMSAPFDFLRTSVNIENCVRMNVSLSPMSSIVIFLGGVYVIFSRLNTTNESLVIKSNFAAPEGHVQWTYCGSGC